MFSNIIIIFFLLGLYLGEKRLTVSSISFHRDDVPFSQKHSSFHYYSTEKPLKHNEQLIDYLRHRTNILKSIQYAPLNPVKGDFPNPADIDNPTSSHQLIDTKVYLEPRFIEKSYNNEPVTQAIFLHYIKGHNIVVPLKPVDLKYKDNVYEHKVFSEKNQEMDQIEYDLSLSKLKQENLELQRDVISLKAVTKANAHTDFNNQQTLPTNEYPTKSYEILSDLENSKIEPVFNSYVKVPRLHLNIARAYNFARLPSKASVVTYQKLLSNNPKKTFVPNIDVLLQEKTFLYPIDKNKYTLRTSY